MEQRSAILQISPRNLKKSLSQNDPQKSIFFFFANATEKSICLVMRTRPKSRFCLRTRPKNSIFSAGRGPALAWDVDVDVNAAAAIPGENVRQPRRTFFGTNEEDYFCRRLLLEKTKACPNTSRTFARFKRFERSSFRRFERRTFERSKRSNVRNIQTFERSKRSNA